MPSAIRAISVGGIEQVHRELQAAGDEQDDACARDHGAHALSERFLPAGFSSFAAPASRPVRRRAGGLRGAARGGDEIRRSGARRAGWN